MMQTHAITIQQPMIETYIGDVLVICILLSSCDLLEEIANIMYCISIRYEPNKECNVCLLIFTYICMRRK